ncbi:MAG: ABC transporter permease [Clostridiaceae bacterium]|nr:ABC transporter permease [Clostridiaceae bacterium]
MNENASSKRHIKGVISYAWREGTVYIILAVLILMFSIINPLFFSSKNLYNLVTQSSYYIIAGMGIAFVMIGGGIDLSVGYEMAMVSTTSAIFMQNYMASHNGACPTWFILLIFLWAIVLGFVMGTFNGLLCAKLGLFPLIVTIATSEVFRGISYTITNSKTYAGMPDAFRAIYKTKFLGRPLDVFLALVCILLAWFVLNKTNFGRSILAVGGNSECARLSGIKTDLVQILTFSITGAVFGVAALVMMAQQNMTSSTTGPGTEFTCLTAAIIGGISFKGGKGNVFGLVAGIFVMQIIANGMQLAGWGTYLQYAVKGIILLAAISFDAIKSRPRPVVRMRKTQQLAETNR